MFKKSFPFVAPSTRLRKIVAALVFWSWNALCLSVVGFGFVPHVLPDLVRETVHGLIPVSLTAAVLCLTVLPLACTVWGIRHARQPLRQFALFYGLEVPLVLFCLFRIFLVRELGAGLAVVIAAFFVACAAYGYELHRQTLGRRWEVMVRLGAQTVAALSSLYLGAILAFYLPVATVALAKGLLSFGWIRPLVEMLSRGHILFVLVGLLLMVSATLFLATPVALIALHLRSFRRVLGGAGALLGVRRTATVVGGTAVVLIGLFVALNQQPQPHAFALLAQAPTNDAERARLLDAADDIRAGLVAAYLAPYRFLASRQENNHLESLYGEVLGIRGMLATTLAGAQKALLAPLLYAGDAMSADQERAQKLYAEFFDRPLQRGERLSILRALSATWDRDQRSAGLLNQDQRQVKLLRQELRVEETGAIASVEIHDVYENQTADTQEIFLAFTLPEGAAVTGLWLGDSEDRERRYAFRVSPRGAAQAVYREEVRGGSDPALVEQLGPGQYRLRAFPVPGRARDTGRAPAFHLWLTYATFAEGDRWATPRLVERRNLYWDRDTERTHDGQTVRQETTEWVGGELRVRNPLGEASHAAVLPGGHLIRRERRPDLGALAPRAHRLAVVMDRSYSMRVVGDELRASLREVGRLGRENDVDLYLTSASSRGEPAERIDDVGTALAQPLVFFGGGSLKEWLRQLDELRADTAYDAVFVLTDGDTLDSADDSQPPDPAGAALWIVHHGGRLAAGYDDRLLALLSRSHGGVTTNLADAVHRFAARRTDPAIVNVEGDHVWTLHPTTVAPTAVDAFTPLGARQLLLALGRAGTALDDLHRIALTYPQVSPYSSMIVLVEDRQHQALAAAESQADRFDREVESGHELLQKPTNPLALTATPEPHEWLLIALAVAATLVMAKRRRGALAWK